MGKPRNHLCLTELSGKRVWSYRRTFITPAAITATCLHGTVWDPAVSIWLHLLIFSNHRHIHGLDFTVRRELSNKCHHHMNNMIKKNWAPWLNFEWNEINLPRVATYFVFNLKIVCEKTLCPQANPLPSLFKYCGLVFLKYFYKS